MEELKLSVCIPTYNRSSILNTTLLNLLDQDLTGVEIVISDNNSTDNTSSVVSGLNSKKIKYFKNSLNLGATINMLTAMTKSKGEYVVILSDEDDLNIRNIIKTITSCEKLDNKIGLILGAVKKTAGYKYHYKNKLVIPRLINLHYYGYKRTYISGVVYRREFLDLDSYLREAKKPQNGYLSVFPHTTIVNEFLIRYFTIMSESTFAYLRDTGTNDHDNVGFSTPWVHPIGRIDQFNSELLYLKSDEKIRGSLFSELMIFNRFRIALGYIAGFYFHNNLSYFFNDDEIKNEVYDLSNYLKYKRSLYISYTSYIKNNSLLYYVFFIALMHLASIWTYFKQKIYLLN